MVDCKKHFRVNSAHDLFRLNDFSKPIRISGWVNGEHKWFTISSNFEKKTGENKDFPDFSWQNFNNDEIPFTADFDNKGRNRYPFFGSSYRYVEMDDFASSQNYYHGQLDSPFGANLGTTIRMNPYLQQLFVEALSESNGTELVVDQATGKLSIQLRNEAGLIVSLPYRSLSDTFRRMMFYTSAIRTSLDKILILEEPEALSFPPYITQLALEIVRASAEKQFFIATHSPYLLTTLIEKTPVEKLAVFACYYSPEEKQTKARRLTPNELSEVLDYGVDLFFNLDSYLNDEAEHPG